MRDTSVDKARLVEAVGGSRIVERDRLAAFVADLGTAFAANPFPSTTAGAARQCWGLREIEFEGMLVASAGLRCLMAALSDLPIGEPLRQEILRSPTHVLYLPLTLAPFSCTPSITDVSDGSSEGSCRRVVRATRIDEAERSPRTAIDLQISANSLL